MEKICRACLKVSSQLKHIFNADKGRIVLMIKECISMNVTMNDGLPDSLCLECFQKLNIAFKFRELYQCNDKVLRATLNIKEIPSTIPDLIYYTDTDDFMENPLTTESGEYGAKSVKPGAKDKTESAQSTKPYISPRNQNSSSLLSDESGGLTSDYNSEMRTTKCLLCNLEFSTNTLLLKHQHDVHIEELHVNSDMMTQMTNGNNSEIKAKGALGHVRSDSSESKYQCEYCNKVFTTKTRLKIHISNNIEGKELFRRKNRHIEDGYEYVPTDLLYKNGSTIRYLRCVKNGPPTKCTSSAKLVDGNFIHINPKHNHDRRQHAQEVLLFRTALQDMARSSTSKPKELYDLMAILHPVGAAQTPYLQLKETIRRWQRHPGCGGSCVKTNGSQ